tara:strand:- start:30 stop:1907 length:1878 start_codon:yes stop_codon:yes gene_type:complete
MAIRQIGGSPVYVVEVDVPKVTDARGRSYGTLVSDLRWKLWEEVQNSQLQQMKFEQMSKQAQLDVLEQKQRDISRAIRDANELKSQIKADTVKGTASSSGYIENIEKDVIDPLTGVKVNLKSKRTRIPSRGATVTTGSTAESAADVKARKDELDALIDKYTKEQDALAAEFTRFAAQPSRDLLGSTRDAFQTQIGEGGFGISRRPLRQLPRFDEAKSVGLLQDTLVREEQALLDEAIKRKADRATQAKMRIEEIQALGQDDEASQAMLLDLIPQVTEAKLTLDEERQIRELARKRLAEGMNAAGAQPTGRAGFLMRDFPQGSALLPREETRFPTGRMRDDFAVQSAGGELDRETVVKGELDRVGLGSPAAEGLLMELEDIRRTKRAPINAPSSLPEAQRRAIEMDALGVTAEEAQTRGATPTERGFTLPVERMGEGFGQTTTFGAPSGILDRTNVATRRLPETPSPSQEREEMESIQFGGGVIPGSPTQPGMEDAATDEVEEVEDKVKVPGRGDLPQGSELPQAKKTLPQRRERYAMKTIKKGLELADKPKQLARLAKTNDPAKAPEYVQLVNKVFELNSNRPDRFQLSFDEIARTYKDDPSTREKAHSYLVAIDAVESNITKPT